MTKTTISNEDRARNFMKYGLDAADNPITRVLSMGGWDGDPIEDVCKHIIMEAAEPYLDDVALAFNIPNDGELSSLDIKFYDDLGNLSGDTLCILANLIEAKTRAN